MTMAQAQAEAEVLSEIFEVSLRDFVTKEDLQRLEARIDARFNSIDAKFGMMDTKFEMLRKDIIIKLGTIMIAGLSALTLILKLFSLPKVL